MKLNIEQPIMEFGIYDDGLLYDNVEKKLYYFYHDENRFDKLIVSDDTFEEFHSGDVIPNMDKEKFSKLLTKQKNTFMMVTYFKLFYHVNLNLNQTVTI